MAIKYEEKPVSYNLYVIPEECSCVASVVKGQNSVIKQLKRDLENQLIPKYANFLSKAASTPSTDITSKKPKK